MGAKAQDEPEVTEPPGELMYIVMGLSGVSDSSHSSCATIEADM